MRWSWIWPRGNKAGEREREEGAIDGQVQFESLGQNYCPERTDRHRHRRPPYFPTSGTSPSLHFDGPTFQSFH